MLPASRHRFLTFTKCKRTRSFILDIKAFIRYTHTKVSTQSWTGNQKSKSKNDFLHFVKFLKAKEKDGRWNEKKESLFSYFLWLHEETKQKGGKAAIKSKWQRVAMTAESCCTKKQRYGEKGFLVILGLCCMKKRNHSG